MAKTKTFGFDAQGVKRIVRTVRDAEGPGGYEASRQTNGGGGAIVIQAQLSDRDGSDKTLYAWSQARRKTDGDWESVTDGLSGTTDKVPAIDVANRGNLNGKYVVMARGVYKDADNKLSPCYYVVTDSRAVAIIVLLESTSGSIGNKTTASSWVYNVKDVESNPIVSGATPAVSRPNGSLAAADFGIGYYPPDGSDFVLVHAFEIRGTSGCS